MHSALLPMRKVLVRTTRGIVDIEYFEIKDNREAEKLINRT